MSTEEFWVSCTLQSALEGLLTKLKNLLHRVEKSVMGLKQHTNTVLLNLCYECCTFTCLLKASKTHQKEISRENTIPFLISTCSGCQSAVLLCARANHRSVMEGTLSYHTQELTFIMAISKVQVLSCTLQTQQSRAERVCASWPLTSCVLGCLQRTSLLLPQHCKDQDVAGLSLI